jgi:4-carboxymuconolactone decarboxylase
MGRKLLKTIRETESNMHIFGRFVMKSFKKVSCLLMVGTLMSVTGCATIGRDAEGWKQLTEPRIKPLAESRWTVEERKVLNNYKMENDHFPNILTTLAHHPTIFQKYLDFIVRETSLTAREREILILRIGWLRKADFILGWHTLYAKKAGMSEEEIARIADGPMAPGWSPFEATLLMAVDELHREAFITDITWNALAMRYNEQQLLDIVFMVGQYDMIAMYLNSVGVQLDPGVPLFPRKPI